MSGEWRNDQGLGNAFVESPRLIKLLRLVLDYEPLPCRKVWNVLLEDKCKDILSKTRMLTESLIAMSIINFVYMWNECNSRACENIHGFCKFTRGADLNG